MAGMDHAPPPFFKRGPAPLALLTFYIAVSLAIFVVDLRVKSLDLFRRRVAHLQAHQVGELAVFEQQFAVGEGLADGRQQLVVVPRLADEAVDADFVHRS